MNIQFTQKNTGNQFYKQYYSLAFSIEKEKARSTTNTKHVSLSAKLYRSIGYTGKYTSPLELNKDKARPRQKNSAVRAKVVVSMMLPELRRYVVLLACVSIMKDTLTEP